MPSRAVVWFRRDLRVADGTSRLSPYLRFGLVSPRQVAAAVKAPGAPGEGGGGRETFVSELLWRDFYAYVLHHRPDSAWRHMRPEFTRFEFEDNPDGLAVGRRHRHRRRSLPPDLQPRHPGGAVRPGRGVHPPLGPELAKLPARAIFAPWQAAAPDLEAAGVRLGADYPSPIVDHRRARDRALSRFQEATARRP